MRSAAVAPDAPWVILHTHTPPTVMSFGSASAARPRPSSRTAATIAVHARTRCPNLCIPITPLDVSYELGAGGAGASRAIPLLSGLRARHDRAGPLSILRRLS